MPTKSTIYSRCNPQLLKLFEQAGHPAKVLCVALDYAKTHHTALICNGLGDRLKPTFAVENTLQGATQLLGEVRACAKHKKIRPEHVFFGGEDHPSFAENFLRHVRQEKFLVVRVNAWEAKQQRDNFQASSDSLDLLGIARCCLNRRGESIRELPQAYPNLRIATRDRDKLVRMRTAVSNRIYGYVDRLFAGFLSMSKTGLEPFSKASLDLMQDRFSPAQLSRRPRQALNGRSTRCHQAVRNSRPTQAMAKDVLPPARADGHASADLWLNWSLYRGLEESIARIDREVAHWLARTPGAWLTSILASGLHHAG
jgi:hypothetical protein